MAGNSESMVWLRLRSARALTAALLCAGAFVIAGCGGDDDSDTTAAAGNTAAETAAGDSGSGGGDAAAVEAAKVDIADFKYDPPEVTIKAGGSVTWTNSDVAKHTASGEPVGDGFDTGTLNKGDSMEVAFDQAGTFKYVCLFHQFMTGTVTVVE